MFENVKSYGAGKFVSRGEWIHPARVIHSNEVIFVIAGTVYITEDQQQYELKKNDMLLLEAGRYHYGHQKSTNTSFYWVHFTGGPDIDPKRKCQKNLNSFNLLLLFKQLLHYRAEQNSEECLNYLMRLILIELFSDHIPNPINRVSAEAAAWITANRDIPLKAEQVAAHFGYNADYLSRVFKADYGMSIKEFINKEKMRSIKELLLSSDMRLAEIAQNTGFSDYKYFLKFFKYHEGITPKEFLKTYAKNHINTK